MSKFETLLIAALVGLCAVPPGSGSSYAAEPPGPAAAPTTVGLRAGDWLVHGRLVGMIPTERTSRIDPIGGRVDTPAAILPDFDLSYFLTDHVSVSGQAGPVRNRPVIRGSLVGDVAVGSIWNAVVSSVVRYHFLPDAAFNPHLGVGVSAMMPISVDPAPGIPTFKVASLICPVLQVGFDYHLTGNWFANAMVKYVFVPPQTYEIAGMKANVEMNLLIVGAGLGYRF